MKKKILILTIAVAVAVTCAFAYRKQNSKPGLKAMTVISVHTFTPLDKSKSVIFLGVNVESYKGDGTFVHRQINDKGGSRYFYSDTTGTYAAVKSSKTTQTLATLTPEDVQRRVQREDAPMTEMKGFQRVENIHGLPLSVIETTIDGRLYKQWASPAHGSIQMERQLDDGLEQIKIVSVTDGFNPEEFARIPQFPKVPKQ